MRREGPVSVLFSAIAMRVALALAIAICGAPLSGCASSDAAETEAVVEAAPVTVDDLAGSLALRAKPMDHKRRVVIEPTWGGELDRILLFPGATSITVRGRRYTAGTAPWEAGGELWLSARDADAIQRMWRESTRLGNPSRPARHNTVTSTGSPPRDRLPPPLPPRASSPGGAPASSAGAASARERAAWSVPLRREWRYIVVHHSATASGSAKSFHAEHLKRKWDGLGYHFVIGNGRGMGDGEIEFGFRWPKQREGAHAGNDLFNQHGIGVCLVGDFSKGRPTTRQMQSLRRLCDFLSAYCAISPENLRLHLDFRQTECPGKYFPRDFRFEPLPGVARAAR
jgi:hypothetical protein